MTTLKHAEIHLMPAADMKAVSLQPNETPIPSVQDYSLRHAQNFWNFLYDSNVK